MIVQLQMSCHSNELIPSRHSGSRFCEQMAFETKRSQWHRAQAARPLVCFGISMARGEKCTCTVQIMQLLSVFLSFA